MHIFRWDLDKTYLQTDIESVRGLIRAGLQTAEEKRNVPGSRALLRALTAHDPDSRVFVLSGSPTQMRDVLAAKLKLDGIQVDQLVLKNNLRNLRRGRLRAVRDQLGYKLPQLLMARSRTPHDATETLFGDDSEVDALVYAAYAALVRGDLAIDGLRDLLVAGRAYPDAVQNALDAAGSIRTHDAVEDIFIHLDRGVPSVRFQLLGARIWPVFAWFQAGLRLATRGRIPIASAAEVVREGAAEAGHDPGRVANLCQDAVRRNLVDVETLDAIFAHTILEPYRAPVERAIRRLGDVRDPLPTGAPRYLDFLRG